MQLINYILPVVAALGTLVAAQDEWAPRPAIGPFGLVSTSGNRKWNNLTVSSVHIGAGINIAQLSSAPAYNVQYYLNDTYMTEPPTGRIAYPVPGTPYTFNFALQVNTSSNIAPLLVGVTQPLYSFSFNKKNELLIDGISRWFVCNVMTPYGMKWAVSWKFGKGPIDDPACVKIGIKKVEI